PILGPSGLSKRTLRSIRHCAKSRRTICGGVGGGLSSVSLPSAARPVRSMAGPKLATYSNGNNTTATTIQNAAVGLREIMGSFCRQGAGYDVTRRRSQPAREVQDHVAREEK